MILKFLKPITKSQRHLIQLNKKNLAKTCLLKKKIKGFKNSSGRNNQGKITVRHKGKGHKKKYRKIKFNRLFESTSIITSIEYDPNRSANIASVFDFSRKKFYYILAPQNITIGDIVKSGSKIKYSLGNSLPISEIPVGNFIHNVSLNFLKAGKLARAAGTFAKVEDKTLKLARLKLPSGKFKHITVNSYATIGIVSNSFWGLTQKGKAGRSRWLNKRPTVRGVAMNPIDHPHGGGEGKKSGSNKTPWGKKQKK